MLILVGAMSIRFALCLNRCFHLKAGVTYLRFVTSRSESGVWKQCGAMSAEDDRSSVTWRHVALRSFGVVFRPVGVK